MPDGFRPLDEIHNLWRERREARAAEINATELVKDAYNGHLTLPYTSKVGDEHSGVPNLIFSGIDQQAMRIASVSPNLICPSVDPGAPRADKRARERRRSMLGWWEHNDIRLSDYLRARWYVGYTCAPVIIRPGNSVIPEPRWLERDPLSTFPAETERPTDPEPPDCIFAYRRPYGWLRKRYPDAYLGLEKRKNYSDEQRCLLLEYADDRETTLMVVSDLADDSVSPASYAPGWEGSGRWVALERLRNYAGICLAVVPGRINLDRRRSPYEDAVHMSAAQALLFALEKDAVMEDIWQNEWVIAQPGAGDPIERMADGRRGVPGIIRGGDIKVVRQPPGYMTTPTRDYIERNIRVTTGQPAEFGGESQTNVRTGRRGEQIISAVVDFPIAEAQTVFARSKEAELRRAIAVAKAYFGSQPRSFYVSWPGARGPVDYTPNRTFETDEVVVTYPATGTDVQNLTIMTGQLLGTGMISTRTAMEMHPFVEDAERENDRVQAEALRRAGFAAIETMASAGQIPPTDIARIAELIESDEMEWWQAVNKVQEEAQERQSTTVDPVQPGSPESMPGIAMPGAGAEAGVSAIPGPPQGQQDISSLLSTLYPVQAAMR